MSFQTEGHPLGTSPVEVKPYTVYTGRKKTSAITTISADSLGRASPTSGPQTSPDVATFASSGRRVISEATAKLLSQRVKADVQTMGLSNESLGSKVVQTLSGLAQEGSTLSAEWTNVLNILEKGSLTLFLPADPAPAVSITPKLLADHLAYVEPEDPAVKSLFQSSMSRRRRFTTLSGLRGVLTSSGVEIFGWGPAPVSTDNLDVNSVISALSVIGFDPLDTWPTAKFPFSLVVPTQGFGKIAVPRTIPSDSSGNALFSSTSSTQTLRRSTLSSTKDSGYGYGAYTKSIGSSAGSRLAALFAKPPVSSASSTTLETTADPDFGTMSPSASMESLSTASSSSVTVHDNYLRTKHFLSLPSLTLQTVSIQGMIVHDSLIASIVAIIIQHCTSDFEDDDLLVNGHVSDRASVSSTTSLSSYTQEVIRRREKKKRMDSISERLGIFVWSCAPPITATVMPLGFNWSKSPVSPLSTKSVSGSLYSKSITEITNSYQDLMHQIKEELVSLVNIEDSETESACDMKPLTEREELEKIASLELKVEEYLENIEAKVGVAFYSLFFRSSSHQSDDVTADERFEAKVLQMNKEQVGLEELGIDIGLENQSEEWEQSNKTIEEAVKEVIEQVSQDLIRFNNEKAVSPKEQLEILVTVHKSLVSLVSKLPPIPLKEIAVPPSTTEVEMDVQKYKMRANQTSSLPIESLSTKDHKPVLTNTFSGTLLPESLKRLDNLLSVGSTNHISENVEESKSDSIFPPATSASVEEKSTPKRSETTSSADILLPLLIFLLISHPPRFLLSSLRYIQRFRSDSLLRGEESYCLTGISAAAEFICEWERTLNGTSLSESRSNTVRGNLKSHIQNYTTDLDHFVDSANSALVNVVDGGYKMFVKGFGAKSLDDVKGALEKTGVTGKLDEASTVGRLKSLAISSSSIVTGGDRELLDIKSEEGGRAHSNSISDRVPLSERLAGVVRGTVSARRTTINASTASKDEATIPGYVEKFIDVKDARELRIKEVEELLEAYKLLAHQLKKD